MQKIKATPSSLDGTRIRQTRQFRRFLPGLKWRIIRYLEGKFILVILYFLTIRGEFIGRR